MTVTSITLPALAAAPSTSDFLVVVVTMQDTTKRIDSITGHGVVWYPAFRTVSGANLAHEVWIAKPSSFSNLTPVTLQINAATANIIAVEHRIANGAGLENIFSAVGTTAAINVGTTSIAPSAAVIAAISGRAQPLTPAANTYGVRLNDTVGTGATQVTQSLIERRVWTAGPGTASMGGTTPSGTDWIATGLSVNRMATGTPKRGDKLGVYVGDPFVYTSAQWATDLTEMQLDGSYVVIECPWSSVEQAQGTDTWTTIDPFVDAAIGAGLSVILALAYTPLWARVTGATDRYFEMQDQYTDEFAAFCGRVAARYKSGGTRGYSNGVAAYQIWNAPNVSATWKPSPNPAKYATILKGAYVAIKNQDSNAYVLFGGTDPAITNVNGFVSMYGYTFVSGSPVSYAPGDWLSLLLGTYACQGFFDGISHHGYWSVANGSLWRPDSATGYPSSPLTNNRNDNSLTVAEDLIDIANVLVPVASQRVLWLTTGQQSAAAATSTQETYDQHVNRLSQMIDRWFDPLDARMQYHGPLLLNTLRDPSVTTTFGLRTTAGAAKVDSIGRSLPSEFQGQANRTDERRGTQPISISTTRVLYVGDQGHGSDASNVVKPTGGLTHNFPASVKLDRNKMAHPTFTNLTDIMHGAAVYWDSSQAKQSSGSYQSLATLSSYMTNGVGPYFFSEQGNNLSKTGVMLLNGDHGGAILAGTPDWQSVDGTVVTLNVVDSSPTPKTGTITFTLHFQTNPWYGAYAAEYNLANWIPAAGHQGAGKKVKLGPTPGQLGDASGNNANGVKCYTKDFPYITGRTAVSRAVAKDNLDILQDLITHANAGAKPCRIFYDATSATDTPVDGAANPKPWDREVFAIDGFLTGSAASGWNNSPFISNGGAVVLDIWNLRTTLFDHQHCPVVGGGLKGIDLTHVRFDSNNQPYYGVWLDCNGANQYWSDINRVTTIDPNNNNTGAKHGFYLNAVQPWESGSDQPNRGTSGQGNVTKVFGFKGKCAVENARGVTGASGAAKGVGGPQTHGGVTGTRKYYPFDGGDPNVVPAVANPVTESHDETFNLDCHGTFGADLTEFYADWNDGPYDVNLAGPTQVDGNKWTFVQNSGANGNTDTDTDPPMSYSLCFINRQRHGNGNHAGGNRMLLSGSKISMCGHTTNDEKGASSESGYDATATPPGRGVGPSRNFIAGDPSVAEYGQVVFDKIGDGGDWADMGEVGFDGWTGSIGTNCDGNTWARYDTYGLTVLNLKSGDAALHYTNGPSPAASNHYGLSVQGTGGKLCTDTGTSSAHAWVKAFPGDATMHSRRTSGVTSPGDMPSAQVSMDVVAASAI